MPVSDHHPYMPGTTGLQPFIHPPTTLPVNLPMRCPCGAEYGHFSRNVVEAVANNETIDGLEVMQERMGMGRVQGTQRADEDKLETGDEDGEWEGDEFDAVSGIVDPSSGSEGEGDS